MEFTDQAIVLGARAHGEGHAIAELFTAENGRWAGLVYGGAGKKMQPVLQAGNGVSATWRARTADQLGHFSLELTEARAAGVLHDPLALLGLSAACATAATCLHEREAHPALYNAMTILLSAFEAPEVWPAVMAKWELGLLAECGFGLTLDRCAATGVRENLVYVSPKSGAAVCAQAGEPYKDRLLALPAFLTDPSAEATREDVANALKLTGYFIDTRLLHLADRELPPARRRLAEKLAAPAGA